MSQVRHVNAVAADYLFLAARVNRKDISLDFMEATLPQTREDAIKVLDQYALVTRRPAESALDVHRLVYCALRERLQADGRLQNGLNTLSHGYSGYFQTTITVIEVNGGDCFRTHGMFYCIPRGTTMRRGWILHGSVPWLCTVMFNTCQEVYSG
jgi:hypothetical protein